MKISNKRYDTILGLFTAVFSTICFILIFCTIDRGTSCDEGYYLLAYLPEQPISWGISQFGFIVRKLFWFLPEDGALSLRYVRFFLNIPILYLFAFSSFRWLKKQYGLHTSSVWYYSLLFLSGVLSFGFASPILYYDNIQLFIYLLVFSIYFLFTTSVSSFFKRLSLIFIGVLCVFGLFNYLPSGILLIVALSVLLLIDTDKVKNILLLCLGLLLGIIVYHLFIRNIVDSVNDIHTSFVLAQKGLTKHSNNQLFVALFRYLVEFVLLFGLFAVLGWLVYYIDNFKNSFTRYLCYTFATIVFLAILLQRWIFYKYYTGIFIMPTAFMVSYFITQKIGKNHVGYSLKELLIFIILLFAPLMGVFGTNQSVSAKMLFFMPFWVVAYFLLVSIIDFKQKTFLKISNTIYVVILMVGVAYFVYFARYHYYYTPKKSNTEITDTSRFRNIKISEWQKDFNDKAIDIMRKNGFKKGDSVLAFYDNFITVYMAGGYIPSNLIYQFEVFVSDKKNIPNEPIIYIFLIEEQDKPMQEFLKDTNWDFPESYMRFDLGKAAENLPAQYNSILYIRKH